MKHSVREELVTRISKKAERLWSLVSGLYLEVRRDVANAKPLPVQLACLRMIVGRLVERCDVPLSSRGMCGGDRFPQPVG